jgi:hypothetical protein
VATAASSNKALKTDPTIFIFMLLPELDVGKEPIVVAPE